MEVYVYEYRKLEEKLVVPLYGPHYYTKKANRKGIRAIKINTPGCFIFYNPNNVRYLCWYKL